MGTANQFAFGSCASKIGCDGAVPPSGQQNGSKPTALRMIEEGAERIVAVDLKIDRSGYACD